MNILVDKTGAAATVYLDGRLDTITAPELEKVIVSGLEGVNELTVDCAGLEYISSAGLRVLLTAQKLMSGAGGLRLTNMREMVKEIFDITGFSDILTIE